MLEPEKLRWLLSTTYTGSERFGMVGSIRTLLYRLASESGLRVSEIDSLTRASFDLDDPEATVMVAAAYAKNRRDDTLPLRPDTAAELLAFPAPKLPSAKASNLPRLNKLAEMLRTDLADARRAWLKDAQELLRHSTIGLTTDVYTHTSCGKLAAALDVLPDLSAPQREAAGATGTDDVVAQTSESYSAPRSARECTEQCNSVQFGAASVRRQSDDAGKVEPAIEHKKTAISRHSRRSKAGAKQQAAMGFEPMNRGFTIRSLLTSAVARNLLPAEACDRGQQAREALARPGTTYNDRFRPPLPPKASSPPRRGVFWTAPFCAEMLLLSRPLGFRSTPAGGRRARPPPRCPDRLSETSCPLPSALGL